ncbi:peptidase M24, structural domain-containing protein [Gorgonomyces haynaldii]|nr:peptidase M24, structural domain-containing protein [Gorgonomyces haynaldii]
MTKRVKLEFPAIKKPVFHPGKYAQENRAKVLNKLSNASGLVFVKGGVLKERQWTDTELPFRQESFFFYLTGVKEPGFALVLDLATKKSELYMPNYDPDYSLWHGKPLTKEDLKKQFLVDAVHQMDQLTSRLEKATKIHVLEKQECDLKQADASLLRTAVVESRVIKSETEIELMRYAAAVSGHAHIQLMQQVKPLATERQLHALFEYECAKHDCHFQAYNPIVASGKRGAVLHYGQNNGIVPEDEREFLLVDAGCEFELYASDITRTYPSGGKFEGDFKTIYEIVLETQHAVLDALKDGVEWEDMHRLAAQVTLEGLIKAEIVKGDEQELIDNHIAALFFPHGLGHLIGIDVHDCGGYPAGVERIQEPGIRYLRMRRTLKEGMCVTVEPGLYFVDAILDKAVVDPKINKYLNLPVLERFRKNVGGVRIEDDVVIRKDGHDNLTGWIPKSVLDVELIMQQ